MDPESFAAETTGDGPASWPVMSMLERRVLGVLVEKAKTTPDAYPLTLNALTNGCNQKSNRDPVLSLEEDEVEETLEKLNKAGLVTRITSSRVDRWRHNLYDKWTPDKVELAILAELLLRGPQTEGELRGRASRMEPINDLEALRLKLQPMKSRKLIVFLGPEGKRGTQLTHGFHDPAEIEHFRSRSQDDAESTVSESRSGEFRSESRTDVRTSMPERAAPSEIAALQAELAELKSTVADLQNAFEKVNAEVRQLKQSLGEV